MFAALLRGDTFGDMANREHQQYPWAGVVPGSAGPVVHYDQDDTFYPWQVFMSRELHRDQFPLWNPYSFGGTPFFANGQSGVLYPPRLALSYLVSPPRVHDLLLVTHLFGAGLAMFLLLGVVGRSFPAAMVGGLAWMLNSFALAWQALEHYVAIEVWLPVAVLLVHQLVRRRSWAATFGLALVLALMFSGANVLFVELAVVVVLGYGIVLLYGARSAKGSATGGMARLAIAVALFTGMILVSLLPTLQLTAESGRVSLSYGELRQFALPWSALENIFKPPVAASDPYHQALFAGTAVGLLALIGSGRREPIARFAGVVAVLTLLFMLYTPVTYVVANGLPGFDNFKPLGRAAFVFQFALAVLAACGLDTLLERLAAWWSTIWRLLGASLVGAAVAVICEAYARRRYDAGMALVVACSLIVVVALLVEIAERLIARRGRRRRENGRLLVAVLAGGAIGAALERFANSNFPSTAVLVTAGILASLVPLVFATRGEQRPFSRGPKSPLNSRATIAVSALIALSIVVQARAWSRYAMPHQAARAADLFPRTPLVDYLERRPEARFLPTQGTFLGSTAMIHSLRSAGGYESLLPERIQNFWRVVGEGLRPDELASHKLIYAYFSQFDLSRVSPTLLARAGVANVVAPPAQRVASRVPKGLDLRYHGRDGRVFSVRSALPRAYLVSRCTEAASDLDALRRFVATDFVPRQDVILESRSLRTAGLSCGSASVRSAGTASVLGRTLNTMIVSVQASLPCWLVVGESWDRGWRATVDGDRADVLPADSAFRAVRVPAGNHTVRFVYEPPRLSAGVAVSASSLALVLVALGSIWVLRGRRRRT
jgi:Bacterial membrane protein YfhO